MLSISNMTDQLDTDGGAPDVIPGPHEGDRLARFSEKTVIIADRLIDGFGDHPIDDPVIEVSGDRIDRVYQATHNEPGSSRVIDLRGSTLLPGLIDAHVHLNLPGDGTAFEDAMREADEVLVANAAFSSALSLRAGITTLRDTGSRGMTTFGVRRALELGIGPGPRLLLCGKPITVTGGHTWYFGGEADGPEGLRKKVRLLIKDGADFIKVISGGGGTPNTKPWLASFDDAGDEEHRRHGSPSRPSSYRSLPVCRSDEGRHQRRRRPVGARRLYG